MNRSLLRPLMSLVAASALVSSLQAQTWETVDTDPFPGYVSNGRDLACAPNGKIYELVSISVNGGSQYFVRRSSDQGLTWSTTVGPLDLVYKLGVDAAGSVYLAGARSSDGFWTVLKSTDEGVSWMPIFAGNTPSFSGTYGLADMAFDATGAVYLAGDYKVYVPKGKYWVSRWVSRWVVRKGVPNQNGVYSWSEVDLFATDSKAPSWAQTVAARAGTTPGSTELFVGGMDNSQWKVRRSVDGGATWATVDALTQEGRCEGLALAPNGDVFAGGRYVKPATRTTIQEAYTLIRRGVVGPSGVTWTEVARTAWSSDGSTYFGIRDLTVDSFGRVFAVGGGAGPSGAPQGWRVWASQDGVAPYFFTDLLTDGGTATSVAFDPFGAVYVAGSFNSPATARVRRLLANP